MGWLIWTVLLPCCLIIAGLVLRRWLRYLRDVVSVDRAQGEFRRRREWLEAGFLDTLGRTDPVDRLRWDDAHWHDEVVWARDRRTGRLLALIEVHFDNDPLDDLTGSPPRHATVLFEYWRGRWRVDGRHLDEIQPLEAFLQYGQFEPVPLPRAVPKP